MSEQERQAELQIPDNDGVTQKDKPRERERERDERIDPCHPERPKFGFSPAPFVTIKDFKGIS